MTRRTAATRTRHTPVMVVWTALALAFGLALLALHPPVAWASNGGGITIEPSPDGVFVPDSSLTASFTTDGALYGNTPLDVSFVSSASGTATRTTYTILSTAATTYTASIAIPAALAPGEYILVIQGQEINGGRLTSNPIIIAAPTPTPLPVVSVPIGTQAHVVPPGPGITGGVVAAAAAGLLLAVSLALLIVPPLRRRGNQPPR